MNKLIINKNDIYQINNISYFKFIIGNIVYRDINCDLNKVNKNILQIICSYCELNYKGLKKSQLIELIYNNNCLIMNI